MVEQVEFSTHYNEGERTPRGTAQRLRKDLGLCKVILGRGSGSRTLLCTGCCQEARGILLPLGIVINLTF